MHCSLSLPALVAVAAVTFVGGVAACAQEAATYRVRGEVVAMEGSGENTRAIIAHEAIPAFKDRKGVASEMPSMTMAFGIGPGVDAKALVPHSEWELAIDVVWSREPMLRIVAAKPLPAGTPLALSKSR